VDDEPDIAAAFRLGLKNYGFDADSYDNPITALSNYKSGQYELLLLDIRMPLMNGFELYKQIRNMDKNVKVCFITAFDINYEDFKNAFPTMTLRHFIKKPVALDELARELKQKLKEDYEVVA
jgi:DNA-binding response OmpR family regulator